MKSVKTMRDKVVQAVIDYNKEHLDETDKGQGSVSLRRMGKPHPRILEMRLHKQPA